MRAVLINAPIDPTAIYGKIKSIGNYVLPLGIAYLAAVLEQAGHKIKVIDALVENYSADEIVAITKSFQPDFVGFTSETVKIYSTTLLAQKMKQALDVPILLGGAHMTAIPEDAVMNDCFDVGVLGEGELTLMELVGRMEKGLPIKDRSIKGIAFKENGKVVITEPRPFIQNLDELPFPARHLFPALDVYKPTPASCKQTPLGTLITSRGCPYRCVFCDRKIFGRTFRARSPKGIVDEVEVLRDKFGAKEIKFWDDTMNANKERIIGICKEMIARKIDLPWSCLGRINNMDEEILGWMKKAGCWQIAYGIESGNDQILKNAMKDLTTDMVRKGVEMTRKAGILPRGFFMLGLPGETTKTMQDTIDFAKSLPLDQASFYITTIYPGTQLYQMSLESGEGRKLSWDKYSCVNPDDLTYIPKGLTPELLKEYQAKAYRTFYMRPGYVLQKLLEIRSFEQVVWNIKGFAAMLKLKDRD